MITLKDITDLTPHCKVWITNIKDYDIVDMINNTDKYIITDIDVSENRLNVLVKKMGECEIFRLNGEKG